MKLKVRKTRELFFLALCTLAATFAAGMLIFILVHIFFAGLPSLTPSFITTAEVDSPQLGGAIANAIVGTILIAIIATLFAIPLAIGTAIYLQKYATDNIVTRGIRFFIEVLSGTPSIVLGIFGLIFLVFYMHIYTGGFSLISGAIALGILILPVIERSTEDALERVSRDLEHGSYALGATKYQTIRNISIPVSMSGISTGILLGFGRAAEESAVVILTAGYTQFIPEIAVKQHDELFMGMKIYPFQDLVGTLPISVYHAYEHSNVIPFSDAFAAALVLIMIVMSINLTAKLVLWQSGKQKNKTFLKSF